MTLGRKERRMLELIRDAGSAGLYAPAIVRSGVVSRWTVYTRLAALVDAGFVAECMDAPVPQQLTRTRHVITEAGCAALQLLPARGPTAHSIGRLYAVLGAPQGGGSPLVDRCVTIEREGQLRQGRGFLFRLPFRGRGPTHGLVVGIWDRPGSGGIVVMGGMEERR